MLSRPTTHALALALALVLSANAPQATAQTMAPGQQLSIIQVGHPLCSGWTEARSQRGAMAEWLEAWAVGYLSGVVEALGVDLLRNVDSNAVFRSIDTDCTANPAKRLNDSARDLAQTLIARATRR